MTELQSLEKIRAIVAPIVADLKLDLYDMEFRGGTLRITIDTPAGSEAGVSLEDITLVTRLIGRDFDHHDPIAGHYTLEVTSPGLERTLRTPAHFQRELGKTVSIRLREVVNAARRFQGVLTAADERTATVTLEEPAADGTTERTVAYDQIDRARTVFVWGPAPKPGAAPAGKAKKAAAPKAPTTTASTKEDAR